jgi:hypothetical protein
MGAFKTILFLAIQSLSAQPDYPYTTTASASYTDVTSATTSDASTYPSSTSVSYASSSTDTGSATSTYYSTDASATPTSDGSTTNYSTDASATPTDSSSSYPTSTSTSCAGSGYNQVNITSPNTITAGKDFTITWTAPQPDPSKNHTEVHVELWALNGGPVGSPLLVYKSDRLFDVTSYTYSFPTSYVNATTNGGPVPWQLYVGVYSTYFSSNITDLESWNLPFYGIQSVTFQ